MGPGRATSAHRLVAATPSVSLNDNTGYLPLGRLPLLHRIRPALLPGLVRRTRTGPAGGTPPAPRVVHQVDAGDPPVQAVHGVTAVLSHRRVLPDLRHRWPAGAFTRRARPPARVPPDSPTLGFTHLQFEALLTTARESPNICDFALVAMLGLLGLRIFEATGADVMHTPDHTRRARHADGVVFLAFSSGSWSGSGGDVRIGQAWQWPMPVSASCFLWHRGEVAGNGERYEHLGRTHSFAADRAALGTGHDRAVVPVRRRAHADVCAW